LRSIICEKKESANLKDKDANQRGKTVSTPNPVRGGEGFVCFAVKTKRRIIADAPLESFSRGWVGSIPIVLRLVGAFDGHAEVVVPQSGILREFGQLHTDFFQVQAAQSQTAELYGTSVAR